MGSNTKGKNVPHYNQYTTVQHQNQGSHAKPYYSEPRNQWGHKHVHFASSSNQGCTMVILIIWGFLLNTMKLLKHNNMGASLLSRRLFWPWTWLATTSLEYKRWWRSSSPSEDTPAKASSFPPYYPRCEEVTSFPVQSAAILSQTRTSTTVQCEYAKPA